MERTSKNRTSNSPNIGRSNFELPEHLALKIKPNSNIWNRTSNFYRVKKFLHFMAKKYNSEKKNSVPYFLPTVWPVKPWKIYRQKINSEFKKKLKGFFLLFPFFPHQNRAQNVRKCSPNFKIELRTLPNISIWPKTELRTSRTSPKPEQFANIGQFVPRLLLRQLVSFIIHNLKRVELLDYSG